jgi:ABC-type oligopeptide transport system ATPase subunit
MLLIRPPEVYVSPAHDYTRTLLAAVPTLESRIHNDVG